MMRNFVIYALFLMWLNQGGYCGVSL